MKFKKILRSIWFWPLILFLTSLMYARSIDGFAAIGIFIMGVLVSVGLLVMLYLKRKQKKSWIISTIGGALFVTIMIMLINRGVI